MPLIPILEFEEKVQLNDKTRLSAVKSFATVGETAIATMTLKPGDDESAISIYNATANLRYLDWAYSSDKFDIDATNNKLYFEIGSTEYTATVTSGTYTLATLLTEIDTQLTASAGGPSFTVTSNFRDQITIACSVNWLINGLKGPNGLFQHIGFNEKTDTKTSLIGRPVEYGIRKLTLTVNNGGTPVVTTKYQKVMSLKGDALYSTDSDLLSHEPDLLKWVVAGRSSFTDVHRRAQRMIVEWLDQNGFTDNNGDKYDKFSLLDVNEVKPWSMYLALELIFRGIHNAVDDVFSEKAKFYEKLALNSRQRAIITLDGNKDFEKQGDENFDTWSGSLFRR